MSKKWPVVPLGQVVKYRKEFIHIDDLQIYKRCRVQLHAQGIVLRDTVSGSEIKTKKQQICHAGELLVAEIDAKVGGYGIVPEELDGAIVSSHYFLFQTDEIVLDKRFLNYFIRTPAFRNQVLAQGSTNYAAIRPHDVLGYKIPLPSVPEQRRIVVRIEQLAAKIEEAQTLRRQAEEESKVLVGAAMATYFNFSGARTTIGDYARVQGGYAFTSNSYEEYGSHQVLRIGNVRDGFLDLSKAPVRWNPVSERTLKYELCPGDLVISMTGTQNKRDYGFVAKVPPTTKLLLNQRVGRFILKKEVDNDYLFYFLRSPFFRDNLFPSATGTANQANVGNGDIEKIPFSPPENPSEQRRIVAELNSFETQVGELEHLQADTVAAFNSLLPAILNKAFRGEL